MCKKKKKGVSQFEQRIVSPCGSTGSHLILRLFLNGAVGGARSLVVVVGTSLLIPVGDLQEIELHSGTGVFDARVLTLLDAPSQNRRSQIPESGPGPTTATVLTLGVSSCEPICLESAQHLQIAIDVVSDHDAALLEDGRRGLEDFRMRLCAIAWLDVVVFDAHLEPLWRWAVLDVVRAVNERIVDNFAVGVYNTNATNTTLPCPSLLWQQHTLTVDGNRRAWRDKIETRRQLYSPALVARLPLRLRVVGCWNDLGAAIGIVGNLIGGDG